MDGESGQNPPPPCEHSEILCHESAEYPVRSKIVRRPVGEGDWESEEVLYVDFDDANVTSRTFECVDCGETFYGSVNPDAFRMSDIEDEEN